MHTEQYDKHLGSRNSGGVYKGRNAFITMTDTIYDWQKYANPA